MAAAVFHVVDVEKRVEKLEDRLARVESLLRDIYNLSFETTFPPELTERLKDFAYNR